MEYLEFELEIQAGSGRDYPVAVLHSPAGEARAVMRFPFDQITLESRLKDLQIALLRSGGRRRRILSPEQQAVQDFGQALFEAVFNGPVGNCYAVSRERAASLSHGLRVKLLIQAPELAVLPWEYLYDVHRAEYICLSAHTPLVRYLELSQPVQALRVVPPLRILGVIASPSDLEPLNVEQEKGRIEQAVVGLLDSGLVELTWLEGQSWRHLQRAMRGGPWHVLHFVGHGGFDASADEGLIALVGEDGRSQFLHATQVGRLLADHNSLRLVVLNACEGARGGVQDVFSGTAAALVRRGIPAVLAMQYEITDRAAIELARGFYEALADGLPVDTAVTEARKAVSMEVANTVEWGTPVLYMRASDGVLFGVEGRNRVTPRHNSLPGKSQLQLAETVEIRSKGDTKFWADQRQLAETVQKRTEAEVVQFRAGLRQYTATEEHGIHILHLSDLHLGGDALAGIYRTQLETDLIQELGVRRLEYLVISGDIAVRSTEQEYRAAFALVDGLVKRFGLDASRVLIVPGNHDLSWDLSEAAYPFAPKRNLPAPLPEGCFIPAGDTGALLPRRRAVPRAVCQLQRALLPPRLHRAGVPV